MQPDHDHYDSEEKQMPPDFSILAIDVLGGFETEPAYPQIVAGLTEAFEKIWDRFDKPTTQTPKYYHVLRHTVDVVKRAIRIGKAIHESDPRSFSIEDILYTALYAAFHDIVQNHAGENEALSGEELKAWMGRAGLDEERMNQGKWSVGLTKGARTADGIGFIQTELVEACENGVADHLPLPGVVIALADLAGAAMDTATGKWETIALKQEMDPDGAWDDWLDRQRKFVAHRQQMLPIELKAIPAPARNAVRALFVNFRV